MYTEITAEQALYEMHKSSKYTQMTKQLCMQTTPIRKKLFIS